MNMKRTLQLTLLLGTISAGLLHAQSISYSTFEVPQAAQNSLSVEAMNGAGVIVGYLTDTSGNLDGWMRDANGDITLLVDPLDTSTPSATVAYGLNNAGTITGYFWDTSASLYYGYFYSDGNWETYTVPNQPAGTDFATGGINNKGSFCGFILQSPYTTYLNFVSIGGQVTVFQVDGSNTEACIAMSDSNTAVGYYIDASGVDHGWVREASGKITTINVPAASTTPGTAPCVSGTTIAGSVVEGINNAGFISGHYWDKKYNEHGFLRTPSGKFISLNVPGAYQTSGGDINNKNEMVGHWATDTSCDDQGYIATIHP
jgi:hypothetical protein